MQVYSYNLHWDHPKSSIYFPVEQILPVLWITIYYKKKDKYEAAMHRLAVVVPSTTVPMASRLSARRSISQIGSSPPHQPPPPSTWNPEQSSDTTVNNGNLHSVHFTWGRWQRWCVVDGQETVWQESGTIREAMTWPDLTGPQSHRSLSLNYPASS